MMDVEFLVMWLQIMGLVSFLLQTFALYYFFRKSHITYVLKTIISFLQHDHPANVALAEQANELNSRCLGEVTYDTALNSIQGQDQPDVTLRTSLLSFVRVEDLFSHIKNVLNQALASCQSIVRESRHALEGKSTFNFYFKY